MTARVKPAEGSKGSAAVQAGFQSALGDAQDASGLGQVHLLEIVHEHRLSVPRRQCHHGPPDGFRALRLLEAPQCAR